MVSRLELSGHLVASPREGFAYSVPPTSRCRTGSAYGWEGADPRRLHTQMHSKSAYVGPSRSSAPSIRRWKPHLRMCVGNTANPHKQLVRRSKSTSAYGAGRGETRRPQRPKSHLVIGPQPFILHRLQPNQLRKHPVSSVGQSVASATSETGHARAHSPPHH